LEKYVVLLSAGLDSTVNLYAAHNRGQVVLALTFDYGQRAAEKEKAAAKTLCDRLQIPHRILALPFFKDWGGSSLVDSSKILPTGAAVHIDDKKTSEQTAKSVWVPNRNGIFLNIAAGFAESLGATAVVPGFNKEEAATFPDNSRNFMQAMTESLRYSTANHVRVECFTTDMVKSEIVEQGKKWDVDWSLMWPCYQSLSRWCGECESCLRSKRALQAADVSIDGLFLKKESL
jgi:7-cyano-7-deazaguanine synthase